MKKVLLIALLSLKLLAFNDFYSVNQEPIQKLVQHKTIKFKGYILRYQASYDIKARVVHAKRYNWDNLSNLITHDFGVVWGKISKTDIFNLFTWNQRNRFLIYAIRQDYIQKIGGKKYINSHIANIHLIPKNWIIESKLNKVKSYDIIEIKGYLVDIYYKNHVVYTSLSRTDTGPGACEVILVNNVKIIHSRTKNPFYYNQKEQKIDTNGLDFKHPGQGTRAKTLD